MSDGSEAQRRACHDISEVQLVTAHRKIVNTLIKDLLAWGPAGRDAVTFLVPDFIPDCP